MSATLLSPLSDQDFDRRLNHVAQAVTRYAAEFTGMADWALNVLTEENRAANLLLVYDPTQATGLAPPATPLPPGYRAMTADELAQYRLYFGQVGDIARRWTEGSPPATGLVYPWIPAAMLAGP